MRCSHSIVLNCIRIFEFIITELFDKELFHALKGISNNQSLGNDGLTKKLYETFWDELKDPFINSIKLAYQKKGIRNFSTSSSYQINR